MNDKKKAGNDNTSKAHDLAKKNFESGKTASQTHKDLNKQRREETVKPVKK